MANPPITIGELDNVPAALSPIQSDWAQEVTRRIVHTFASVAARAAGYTGMQAGALSLTLDRNVIDYWNGSAWTPITPQRIDPVYNPPGAAIAPGGSAVIASFTIPAAGSAAFTYAVLASGVGNWFATLRLHTPAGGGVKLFETFGGAANPVNEAATLTIPGTILTGLTAGQIVQVVLENYSGSTTGINVFADLTNQRGHALLLP